MRWPRYTLVQGSTLPHHRTLYNCGLVVSHLILGQSSLCWVWVGGCCCAFQYVILDWLFFFQLGNIPCCWSKPQDEGWELTINISFLGLNYTLAEMYQWYQIMICLLKFDFFCFSGVTMQVRPMVRSWNMLYNSISAPNCRAAAKFCRIWSHRRCYTRCLNSSLPM